MIESFFRDFYVTFKILSDMTVTLVSIVGLYLLCRIYKILKREVAIFEELSKTSKGY